MQALVEMLHLVQPYPLERSRKKVRKRLCAHCEHNSVTKTLSFSFFFAPFHLSLTVYLFQITIDSDTALKFICVCHVVVPRYRLLGSWGFSPSARHWESFRAWYHSQQGHDGGKLKPYVKGQCALLHVCFDRKALRYYFFVWTHILRAGLMPTTWYQMKETQAKGNVPESMWSVATVSTVVMHIALFMYWQ